MTEKRRGIFLSPEIYIQSINLIQVLLLVPLIVTWYMPLLVTLHIRAINGECKKGRLFVRICQLRDMIEVARKGILVGRSGMVCYLDLGSTLVRILEEIQV